MLARIYTLYFNNIIEIHIILEHFDVQKTTGTTSPISKLNSLNVTWKKEAEFSQRNTIVECFLWCYILFIS